MPKLVLQLSAAARFGNGELKHLEEQLQKQLDAHPEDMTCYVCQNAALICKNEAT